MRIDSESGLVRTSDERFGRMIGRSPAMQIVFDLLGKAAPTDATILLEGETGTGKEVSAEAIHRGSPRAATPFLVVDCGAMPPATNTPPVASTMSPRLPAVAPRTEQKIESAISQTGSAPDRARCEIAAAGSWPGPCAASAAEVSGRSKARQAGSSARNVNTSTNP